MAKLYRILVVDDDEGVRDFFEIFLSSEGYIPIIKSDPFDALDEVRSKNVDICLVDIRMPRMNGVELLREIKKIDNKIPVVLITAYASIETAIEAMREGALDYVLKPFEDLNALRRIINQAIEQIEEISRENNQYKNYGDNYFGIIAKSSQMKRIIDILPQVAKSPSNVLITGESGTGKELIARAIHKLSDRKDKNFVVINCGGIPENLLESELFGYKKGAFTGADRDKQGLFLSANEGVIFLDEIGELTLPLQVKLLRVIQEKTILPLGESKEIKVDVRIIAATNRNLEEEVIKGKFREDLYYRLNVINIHIPPLRERKEDIPVLIKYFLEKYAKLHNKPIPDISDYALKILLEYPYPGNVRELENIIERGVALSTTNIILPESLNLAKRLLKENENKITHSEKLSPIEFINNLTLPENGIDLEKFLESIEKKLIKLALEKTNNIKKDAANLLRLDMRSFRYRLDKYDIT